MSPPATRPTRPRPSEPAACATSPDDTRTLRAHVDTVLDLMRPTNRAERARARSLLQDLFEGHPHPSTFHALRSAAIAGLDTQTLEAMIDLKETWSLRSDWWFRRYLGEIVEMERGPDALSWKLARQVCLARWHHPSESMIDEDWFDEWLTVPRRAPGHRDFLAFIREKIDDGATGELCAGLRSLEADGSGSELADDADWWRTQPLAEWLPRVPHPGAIR